MEKYYFSARCEYIGGFCIVDTIKLTYELSEDCINGLKEEIRNAVEKDKGQSCNSVFFLTIKELA